MKHALINYRMTAHTVQSALTRVLLMLVLAAVSLPASSAAVSPSPVGNLALGMPVVVSSVDNTVNAASNAVDGNTSTRWSSSYSDSQWIYVNLGATYSISRVVLDWEVAYGKGYQIQVSADAKNWDTVYSEGNGNGDIDDVSFAPINARYVRVLGLQRGTNWGYSLWEIGVYTAGNSVTNKAPVISGTPITSVQAGIGYAFQPSATDADGNTLRFQIVNQPAWASFNTSTGRLSGTPGTGSVGTYNNIVISVSDGKSTASLPAFSIRVNSATTTNNRAPVISGTPATSVSAGNAYAFQPSATDADGNTLSFGIGNKPAWASFNTSTGRLSGTPATGNVGSFNNIVISVSDGKSTASLPAFSIRVNTATTTTNRAPVISGTPAASVLAGSAYAFQPSATDADGNALSFSISNKPAWASFNTTTGRLSGTPATGNVGTFNNIVISASDGKVSASLPAFSIRVDAASAKTGTITLSWTAPTKRADGTPLSLADIDGYRIHYGKAAGSYTSQVNVADGTAQKVNLTDLPVGTYYLVMTTYDVNGRESGNSSMVTKNVP